MKLLKVITTKKKVKLICFDSRREYLTKLLNKFQKFYKENLTDKGDLFLSEKQLILDLNVHEVYLNFNDNIYLIK